MRALSQDLRAQRTRPVQEEHGAAPPPVQLAAPRPLEPWVSVAPIATNGAEKRHPLTRRQAEVAMLIARGYSNAQIAAELVLVEGVET